MKKKFLLLLITTGFINILQAAEKPSLVIKINRDTHQDVISGSTQMLFDGKDTPDTIILSAIQAVLLKNLIKENSLNHPNRAFYLLNSWVKIESEREALYERLYNERSCSEFPILLANYYKKGLDLKEEILQELIKVATPAEINSCLKKEQPSVICLLEGHSEIIMMLKLQGRFEEAAKEKNYAAEKAMHFGLWNVFRELQTRSR